ncbi:hypothetical protein KPH14_012274 [Odynerus spinipes]|uniref:Integrase catalytic domain-containing protein n=1 Tax=Odynerus spinipes TaxID=1348599 RepID=A0AAD9VLB0_9HYME|nr:hypothetical protein KPH14_012274 [Odynerus spinipes]
MNLLSVAKITNKDLKVTFSKTCAVITDSDGNTKVVASCVGGLYYVREKSRGECNTTSEQDSLNTSGTLMTWHRRLGHVNAKDLLDAVRGKIIRGVDLPIRETELEYEICIRGKMTRTPFPKRSMRETELLEIIHSDVCGPMKTILNGRAKYFVTFIDDHSRWTEVRFLKLKDKVFAPFKEFKQLVENLQGRKIKYLQSDNGGEYLSREFNTYLREHGIARRLSVARNPEQNGIAEKKNRTLLDTARCLLLQEDLPSPFWAEAINTANYIGNRCPTKSLTNRTPYEAWTHQMPDVSHMKEFGCKVFFLNREVNKDKFQSRCKEGIFIGYSEHSKGYRVWLPQERKVEVVRDVRFLENKGTRFEEHEKETFDRRNEAEEATPLAVDIDLELSSNIEDHDSSDVELDYLQENSPDEDDAVEE